MSDPRPAETDRGAHCTGKHFTALRAVLAKRVKVQHQQNLKIIITTIKVVVFLLNTNIELLTPQFKWFII